MKDKLKELYRQWLSQQPLYEVETMESHAAAFAEWLFTEHEIEAKPILTSAQG